MYFSITKNYKDHGFAKIKTCILNLITIISHFLADSSTAKIFLITLIKSFQGIQVFKTKNLQPIKDYFYLCNIISAFNLHYPVILLNKYQEKFTFEII